MFGLEDILKLFGVSGEPPSGVSRELVDYEISRAKVYEALLKLQRLAPTNEVAKTVSKRIADADKQVKEQKFSEALKTLQEGPSLKELSQATKLADQSFREQISSGNDKRRLELLQLANKEPLVRALEEAGQAIRELTDLPAAHMQLEDIKSMVTLANTYRDREQYVEGLEALNRVAKVLETGRQVQQRAERTAQLKCGELFKNEATCQQLLKDAPELKASVRDTFAKELKAALGPVVLNPNSTDAQNAAAEAIRILRTQIEKAAEQARLDKRAAEDARRACNEALVELREKSTVRDRAELERDVTTFEAWIEQGEYQQVVDARESFLSRVKDLTETLAEKSLGWEKAKQEIRELLNRCSKLDKHAGLTSVAKPPAEVTKELNQLSEAEVGERPSLAEALEHFAELKLQVGTLEERAKAHDEFSSERSAAAERVTALLNLKVEPALRELSKSANSYLRNNSLPLVSHAGKFGKRLDELKQRWQERVATALSVEELDEATTTNELTQFLQEVSSQKYQDNYLSMSNSEACDQKLVEFRQKVTGVRESIGALKPYGVPNTAEFEKSLGEIVATAERSKSVDQIEGEQRRLTALHDDIQRLFVATKLNVAQAQSEFFEKLRTIEDELDQFRRKVEQYKGSFLTKNPEYEKYLETLVRESETLLAMQGEKDLDVLHAGQRDAEKLLHRAQVARQDLTNQSAPKGIPVLDDVNKGILQAKKWLADNSELAEYCGSEQGQLDQALKDLESEKLSRPFDETMLQLDQWNVRYRKAANVAAKAAEGYKQLQATAKETRKRLKNDAFEAFPNYVTQLTERIDKCVREGKDATGLPLAEQQLTAIGEEITEAINKPEVLNAKSGIAVAEQQTRNNEAAEWQGLVIAFEKLVKECDEKGVAKNLRREIAELGKIAKQTFKQTQDFAIASGQLDVATRRAKDAIAFPQGAGQQSRKNLPDAAKQWGEAVKALRTALTDIVKAVEKEDPETAKVVQKELKLVGDLFLEGSFTKVAEQLGSGRLEPAEVLAAREEGLRHVRRYQSLILKDLRAQLVYSNPFVTPFRALNQMNHALVSLEYNLLTSS